MEQQRMMHGAWYLRWVMLGLMGALAIALIASGAVVIGGLLGALAIVRTVMFVSWTRRRRELGARFPGRGRSDQ